MKTIRKVMLIIVLCMAIATVIAMLARAQGPVKSPVQMKPGKLASLDAKTESIRENVEVPDCGIIYEITETTEPDPQDVEYLAIAIYCEAGADYISDETRYMVGDVILNRVADSRFPDTIKEVLTEKRQFGRFYWTGIIWPKRASDPNEADAVQRARDTAFDLLSGNHSRLYGGGWVWQAEFAQGIEGFWQDGIYFGR